MESWLLKHGTQRVLRVLAWLARRQGMARAPAAWFIRSLGTTMARFRRVVPSSDAALLGAMWQRAFPSKKHVPIVALDRDTAYGEIHTRCPLRGTGDLDACHRMMGYDRAFMEPAGARFVVIESQAQKNVTVCKIAIQRAHRSADDLNIHTEPR